MWYIIGWMLWGTIALLAVLFAWGCRSYAKSGHDFQWATGVQTFSWWVILVLFLIFEWNKLHILWIAPIAFFSARFVAIGNIPIVSPAVLFLTKIFLKIFLVVNQGKTLHINDDLKTKQIRVLMGNFDDPLNESLFEYIEIMFKNKYDLKFLTSGDGPEILELADRELVDIFILVINNINHWDLNALEDRLENNLQLITQLKTIYGKPVIALLGWREDASVIERAKISADFFFFMPFEFEVFKDAIEKCFEMLPASDSIEGLSSTSTDFQKIALIKSLVKKRIQNDPIISMAGNIAALSDTMLMGLPEATIVTIVEIYIQLKKQGRSGTESLKAIESHRASCGDSGILPSKLTLSNYIKYRIELEHSHGTPITDEFVEEAIKKTIDAFS